MGFVAHLHKEEGDDGGHENAAVGFGPGILVLFVGDQGPSGHRDKGHADPDLKPRARNQLRHAKAHAGCKRVIDHGCHKNPGNDRDGLIELARQNDGEQLGFVADLSDGDNQR